MRAIHHLLNTTTIELHIQYVRFHRPYKTVYHEGMNHKILLVPLLIALLYCIAPNIIYAQSNLATERIQIDVSDIPQLQRTWWQTLLSYVGLKSNSGSLLPIGTVLHVVSSAYAPSTYQTDGTPCITAAGTTVRPGVVATNFLPLGTIVSIESKKYIVEDRMNSRYKGYYMDIWFPSTSQALDFGRKKIEITIVDYGKPGDILETPSPTPVIQADNNDKKN